MDITPYIKLLQSLVRIPSFSGEESETANLIQDFLEQFDIPTERIYNNIIARNKHFNDEYPTIILNSHHDTVKVGNGWTRDPLGGEIDNGILYGRGSNDAGGALVSLIAAFCYFYELSTSYNLVLVASGEEENFGSKGVSSVLKQSGFNTSLGIIGEPTQMNMAIAEKGLIVIDALVSGKSGHAARDKGVNAIYLATNDINWIRDYKWTKKSDILDSTKATITQISAGSLHNVIPDECSFVIDCRVNELYTLEDVLSFLNEGTEAVLTPRSLKWRPSGLQKDHPIVLRGRALGRETFGSPTLSDQVHFKCPTIKIGPGKSERSHTADEFIQVSEIEQGIKIYIDLLTDLKI